MPVKFILLHLVSDSFTTITSNMTYNLVLLLPNVCQLGIVNIFASLSTIVNATTVSGILWSGAVCLALRD